jgi:ribosome maturation factor RimP
VREQQIISAELGNLGYALVDIEREAGGLLRVTIENQDYERLITVEDCEKVSHQLSYSLPVENIPYERLEISSPGLDRPVKSAADFVRFAGFEVDLKLRIAVSGRKNFRGVLEGSSQEALTHPMPSLVCCLRRAMVQSLSWSFPLPRSIRLGWSLSLISKEENHES